MKSSRYFLWSCYASMIGISASVNVTPVCLSSVTREFSLTSVQQGLLIGTLFWGYIISLLITGPMSDRYGPRRFFYLATVLQILGFALLGFAWSGLSLAGGSLLVGLGGGILETILTPVVCALFPRRKTSAVNLLHAFYAIGSVGVVLVARYILQFFEGSPGGIGWRMAYWIMLAVPVVYGAGFVISFRAKDFTISYPHSDSMRATAGRLWRWGFLVFVFGMLAAGGTEISVAQWLPFYLESVFDWSQEGGATGLLVYNISMGVCRFCTAAVSRRMTPVSMLILSCTGSAIFILIVGATASGQVAFVTFALLGFFVGWLWPTTLSVAAESFPRTGATMFALLAAVGNAGGILFPAMVGWITALHDLRLGMSAVAVVPALAAILFLVWKRRAHGR